MYAATLAILLVSVNATPVDGEYYVDDAGCGVEAASCYCDSANDCQCGAQCSGECDGQCDGGCNGGGGRHGRGSRGADGISGWCGPMPQTCYAPRYGCYPGNNRHMHRYPAFHGVYYRRPYNYRNLFDYPWHAELHEPTSLFSYETPEEEEYANGDSDQSEDFDSSGDFDDAPPKPEADPVSIRRSSVRKRSTATHARLRPVPESETTRLRVSNIQRRHRPGSR